MFLKACESAFAHTGLMTHTVKAGICFARWGRRHWGNEKYNSWLLNFDSKDKTLKVLDQLQETADPGYQLNYNDLITFDKLSESANSETHRVFDLYHKKFFALKTLSLHSEMAWKEVNLMLRQHFNEMNYLAPVRSLTYDEAKKEVKILSEIQETVLGDYAYFHKRQGLKWNSKELKAIMWNLLKIINTLKSHETDVNYLRTDGIFLDSKEGKLKAFDYPGATIGYNFGFKNWGWQFMDSTTFGMAVHTLVKIVDPHAPVDNPEEARAYLNVNYPEFKADLLEIEINAKGAGHFQYDLLPLEEIFQNKDFDKYLLGNLKKTFDQKPGRNTQEDWAIVNQGLGKFDEAETILKSLLNENINRFGITHPVVTKNYLHLAELYQDQEKDDLASKYFQNAFNSSRSNSSHDKELLGRLHMKYGKLLMKLNPADKNSALNEFQQANDLLSYDIFEISSKSRLKHEVEKLLEDLNNDNNNYKNSEYCNPERWEKRRWKKRKIIKIIFYLIILNWIYKKWFKHHPHHEKGCDRGRQVEETKQNAPQQPKPEQHQKTLGAAAVATNVEPKVIQQPAPVVAASQEKSKVIVEPSFPKTVAVSPDETQQDSKFAWFLFGLNIAIGFAGLTLPSVN